VCELRRMPFAAVWAPKRTIAGSRLPDHCLSGVCYVGPTINRLSYRHQPAVVPLSALPGGRGALRSNRTPIIRITKHTAAAPKAGSVPP
jgi:hypothetical protein